MTRPPATAQQVADLYGVAKSTVHRWVDAGAFDPAPMIMPSPSGERDRVLFDRDAVAKQFREEMLNSSDTRPPETTVARNDALEAFLNA